jgi:hypothetical protein
MASDTRNVKIGVCKVFFDGIDLGYTKGGVEVEVSTDTYKSEVDQFGKTPISEIIMGRMVKAKVPMAETTLENMVQIMPGATIVATGGGKATGTITIATNLTANQTLTVNGATVTAKASGAVAANNEFNLGGTAALTAASLQAFLQASTDYRIAIAQYSVAAAVVTVTFTDFGVAGNSFTIATGTAGASVTVSGANLTGGIEPTAKRVDVTDAVSVNLLTIAKELRLHPQEKPDTDKSDDFVIPLAATAGALQFAYKLEEERVYNVEFQGYPDSTTRRLYYVGS